MGGEGPELMRRGGSLSRKGICLMWFKGASSQTDDEMVMRDTLADARFVQRMHKDQQIVGLSDERTDGINAAKKSS